jgi:hypothetical protein
MPEARIGRLLAACLHQSIAEVLTDRVEFYEYWLGGEGVRDNQFDLAQTVAVFGFLRTEGDAYDRVMTRAGVLAAEWTLLEMSAVRRRFVGRLPRAIRARVALREAAHVVRAICSVSRAKSKIKKDSARFDVKASVFCEVRETRPLPLCGFYASLAGTMLAGFGLNATSRVEQCRAVGESSCVVSLDWSGTAREAARPMAA